MSIVGISLDTGDHNIDDRDAFGLLLEELTEQRLIEMKGVVKRPSAINEPSAFSA